jgi:hypothetical protein
MDSPTTFRFADPLQTIHSTRERKHGPVASVSPDPSQGVTTGYSSVNNQFQGMDAPTTFRFADPLQTIHSTRDMGSHGVNSTNGLGANQGSEREHVPTNSLQTSEGAAQEFEREHVSSNLQIALGADQGSEREHVPTNSLQTTNSESAAQESEREFVPVASVQLDPLQETDLIKVIDPKRNDHVDFVPPDPLQATDTMKYLSSGGGIQGSEQEHGLIVSEPNPIDSTRGLDDERGNEGEGHADAMLLDPLQATDMIRDFSSGGGNQGLEQEHGLIVSEPPNPIDSTRGLDDERANEGEGHADAMLLDPCGGGIQGSEQEHGLIVSEPPNPIDSTRGLDDERENEGEGHADAMLLDPLQATDTIRDFRGIQGSEQEHGLIVSEPPNPIDSTRGVDDERVNEGQGHTGAMLLDPLQATDRIGSEDRTQGPRGVQSFEPPDSHPVAPIPSSRKSRYRVNEIQFPDHYYLRDQQPSVSGDDNTFDPDGASRNSSDFEYDLSSSCDESENSRAFPKRRKHQVSQYNI